MERINYEFYVRRAHSLRSRAMAEFARAVAAGLIDGIRGAAAAVAAAVEPLRAPKSRTVVRPC